MQKTANQIKSSFETLASGHYQIHSFLYAQEFEQQAYENLIYPLMLVYPLGGSLSGTTYSRNYRVIIADRVLKSEGNELEVESDTQLIALDVLAYWMKLGQNERFTITSSNTITPFWEKWGDEVTGHFVDIGIEEFYDFNSCAIPLSGSIPTPPNPCKDARISVNSVVYGNAPSDTNFNVVVKDQDNNLVGSLIGGEWIVNVGSVCENATYTIEDSLGNILYSGSIPSGGTLTQAIGNSTLNINNSVGTLISSESILAEGTDNYNVADSVAVINDSAGNTLKSENILATASENITINDSVAVIKDSANNTLKSENILAEATENITINNSTVANSDASYSVGVLAEGSLILPDQQINLNNVDEGDIPSVGTIDIDIHDGVNPVTPTSVTITGRIIDIVVPAGGGSYNVGNIDRFGNTIPTIVVNADTTLNWKAYNYANFFLSKETNWATSGYTDTEARTAITDLVAGLITDGIWEKLYCFFPFVGGTSSSHKWNLKNPNNFEQDILYFVGSPTHNELGVVMNGSTNAAYININPRQFKTGYEFNFGCYSQGGTSTTNNVDIGYYIGLNSGLHLSIKYNTSVHRCGMFSAQSLSPYTGDDTSFFIVNRLGSSFKSRRNTTNLISVTTTADGQSAMPNMLPLTLGAAINSGLTGYTLNAARTYSCFWHGTGLTDTEMTNFNTRVQDFNLALNRQQV